MPPDEDGRHVERVAVAEGLHDHVAGVPFVRPGDLGLLQRPGHRDGPMEKVGVGGAEARDRPARLGKTHRLARVGVHDRANAGEGLEQAAVRRFVRRRPQLALEHAALQVDQHHLGRTQVRVRHAARLDREYAGGGVQHTCVAEGEIDQPGSAELAVGNIRFFPQGSMLHGTGNQHPGARPAASKNRSDPDPSRGKPNQRQSP